MIRAVPDGYRLDGPPYRTEPNLIQPARRIADDVPVVLKVHAGDEYLAELTALRHYNAFPTASAVRVVSLLDHDDTNQTLVLERIAGERLDHGWPDTHPDVEITTIMARAMVELWQTPLPVPGAPGWWELADYMRALQQPARPGIDRAAQARAAALARELRSEPGSPVVLHGDLHHENVMTQADGTVVVIDPKAVIGNCGFDVAALLGNPLGRLEEAGDVTALLSRRLEILAAELHRHRSWVSAWGWVGAVLGAVWSVESGQSPKDHLAVADAIRAGR